MSIIVNISLFDRVKRFIAETGRVKMEHWASVQDATPITFVGEIRDMPLIRHSRAFACVAGWTCFLATGEEIARAISLYRLAGGAIDDPFTLAAALLLDGAKDVERAKAACRSHFRLTHWPPEESATYRNSLVDAERADVVIRRMDIWRIELSLPRKERRSLARRNRQEAVQS
jgi:hypothetical protein